MERPSIKNEEQYETLRDMGYSKERAARIANADNAGKNGQRADPYEQRIKNNLCQQAKQIGIE